VLLGQDVVYVSEPKYLWQYINNVTVALRVLAGHTFELVPGCTARGTAPSVSTHHRSFALSNESHTTHTLQTL